MMCECSDCKRTFRRADRYRGVVVCPRCGSMDIEVVDVGFLRVRRARRELALRRRFLGEGVSA